MFGLTEIFSSPLQFIVAFIALVVSIGWHEFSHVLAADLQGDHTGRSLGRLTLNPIKHLDPIGTLAIIFVGVGWGKPAPFNPYALRWRRWGPAVVALAGPISNILLILVAGYALLWLNPLLGSDNLLRTFLTILVIINGALTVFNLIPVHPLDGSHLVEAILGSTHPVVRLMERYGTFILLGLLFLGGSFIGNIIVGGMKFILNIFGLGQLI